jgi:phosphomannomutase/phosphoglucomutase
VNVKHAISAIHEDQVILRSIALGLIGMAIATAVMWQQLVVEPRLQAAEKHYGINISAVADRVDLYMAAYLKQLGTVANQPGVIQSFAEGNQTALDQLESQLAENLSSRSLSEDTRAIYFIDPEQRRHTDQLGYAAKQMVSQSLAGNPAMPRAAKINGQWQLLIARPVPDQSATNAVGGVILLRLSMKGLTSALSIADTTNGTLEFLQLVPNRGNIALISLGERSVPADASIPEPQPQLFNTANKLWKIAFTPSQTLAQTIDRSLPPFWGLFAGTLAVAILLTLILINVRVKAKARQTAIFIETDSDEDALFAPDLREDKAAAQTSQLDSPQIQPSSRLSSSEPLASNQESFKEERFSAPDVVFRDYDIRGLAGSELTPEFASRLGKTLGTIILKNNHSAMYVGRDGRLSSPELATALKSGLQSTGCKVIDLGEVTTPILNFAIHTDGQSSCGIMVTASHNPARYNGFKIIIQGQVIAGRTLQLLKPMLQEHSFTTGELQPISSHNIVSHYVQQIVADTAVDQSFRIVVDAGNAVPGPIAMQLFDSLGCLAFPMHCEIDGAFPNHEPNPADERNLQGLIAKVKELNADLGFALDGDGDRLVAITSSGEIVWPDRLMMIFARDILRRNPGADIVFDVKSSKRLAEIVRQYSGRPVMCKTGHSHVRKAVHQNRAPLGGEYSGHIFFNDRWSGFDDGLYAAVRLLEILCSEQQNRTLDSIISEFEASCYTPEILIPIDETEKFSLMATLEAGCLFKGGEIITLDGLRVEYPKGWGLIRASNTSANLTLRFEADDPQSLTEIKQRFSNELSPFINNMENYI